MNVFEFHVFQVVAEFINFAKFLGARAFSLEFSLSPQNLRHHTHFIVSHTRRYSLGIYYVNYNPVLPVSKAQTRFLKTPWL